MDFMSICRTCMSDNALSPIFTESEESTQFQNVIFLITGVNIIKNDGLPQKLCLICLNHINDSLKFRSKCKETEDQLLNVKSKIESKSLPLSYKLEIKNLPERISNNNKECVPEHLISKYDDNTIDDDDDNDDDDDDDDDDKPLKYLMNTDRDSNSENIDEFNDPNARNLPLKTENTNNIKKETCKDINTSKHNGLFVESIKLTNNDRESVNSNDSLNYVVVDGNRVICKLCQKNLSIRSIDTHMSRSHPGADDRKTKCLLCDSYIMKDKMNRHKALIHGSEALRCRYCKWEFLSEKELTEHVVTCTARKKRKVCESSRELLECDICHKTMQRASLRMHKAIKHAGLGPVCEHCGNRFGNKFRLNEHYRAKHGYEKFKCSYCEFESAGVTAMRNHERRHRGEKPFVCEACGAKFHAAYLLAQHRHSHRTDRRYKCETCGARFKANNSLHTHKRACHSAARASCALCARSYSCRHYAARHARNVHRARVPAIPAGDVTDS